MAVEQRVDYSAYAPEGYGTADCIIIGGGVLDIVDYKYGKGFSVEAEDNPQLKLYALGALYRYGMLYDIDRVRLNLSAGSTDDILRRIDGLGCGYCVYSTRKHHPSKPRLRVLLPLDKAVTPDEYEAIARKVAYTIDSSMLIFDGTTFEPSRLMYWPSCCSDGEYVYKTADKPFLSSAGMLATYEDWHDISAWPVVPGAQQVITRTQARAGEPTEKPGVIGAFCKVYDIPAAMDKYLRDIYSPAGEGRYTYAAGSTTGGAITYNDGKFLYSHHATDPVSGKLVNAFDLVRIHLYGHLDDEAKPDTPVNRLPSSVEMMKLAAADPEVQKLMDAERYAQIAADFAADIPVNTEKSSAPEAPAAPIGTIDTSWMQGLKRNPNTGQYEKTIDNMIIVLTHDPLIAPIGYDDFASRVMALGAMPWNRCSQVRPWDDTDDAGFRWYLEKAYGMTGRDKAQDAVTRAAALNTYDPIKDYLNGLKWDGVPRLDTLFVDYLGAADNEYTRAAARKSLCAAVARVFKPGAKYDFMPVLTGPQGIGKSTLLRRIGRDVWFTDAVNSFDGKEADEIIRGMWIVEIGELEAMNRSEVGRVKQVLSQNVSRFRAAYGRHVQDIPRRCVFFGTSNNREYLRDSTGGRRFWPIDCSITMPTKDVFKDLAGEVDQLWAEAVEAYKKGEKLYMTGGLAEHAKKEQEEHREHSPLEGMIAEWLDKKIPVDWQTWDLQRRRMYWNGGLQYEGETELRQRVCAVEIWCEYLNGEQKNMQRRNAIEINAAMQTVSGWEYMRTPRVFGQYGNQRGYERVS